MAILSSEQAKAMAAKRRTFGRRNPRKTILELQELLLKDMRKPKLSPAIRAKCAIAFDKLEDRLRVLANKPMPGQLRPDLRLEREQNQRRRSKPAVLPLPEVDHSAKESLLASGGGGGV